MARRTPHRRPSPRQNAAGAATSKPADAQPVAALAPDGEAPGVPRCRCGQPRSEADPRVCAFNHPWPGVPDGKGAATRFRPANTSALKHGLRASELHARTFAEAAERLSHDEARVIEAMGRRPDALELVLVRRLVRAVMVLEGLEEELLAKGASTTAGRARRLLAPYGAQADRVRQLAQQLRVKGAEAAPAPNFAEYARRKAETEGRP